MPRVTEPVRRGEGSLALDVVSSSGRLATDDEEPDRRRRTGFPDEGVVEDAGRHERGLRQFHARIIVRWSDLDLVEPCGNRAEELVRLTLRYGWARRNRFERLVASHREYDSGRNEQRDDAGRTRPGASAGGLQTTIRSKVARRSQGPERESARRVQGCTGVRCELESMGSAVSRRR